jgi:hypothetical protein
VYVTETGQLAVLPAPPPFAADWKESAPVWSHALDLKARAPGADEFTKDTPLFGVEVYQDPNAWAWVYLTETRHLAVAPAADVAPKPVARPNPPVWLRRLAGTGFAAEVFQNANAGHTVYITSAGAVTVTAADKAPAQQP